MLCCVSGICGRVALVVIFAGLCGCDSAARTAGGLGATPEAGSGSGVPLPTANQLVFHLLGETSIIETELGTPPSAFGTKEQWWLYVRVPSVDGPSGVRPSWEGLLLAVAFNDETTALRDKIGGVSIAGEETRGCRVLVAPSCEAAGSPVASDVSLPPPVDPSALERTIRKRLTALGLRAITVTYRPVRSAIAPIVVAQIKRPMKSVKLRGLDLRRIFGGLHRYPGVLLEVDDRTGAPVIVSATVFELDQGLSWARPS